MKKLLLIIPMVAAGITTAGLTFATSTVIIDSPNISEGIGSAYNTAQPLWNSVEGILWMIIGITFVGVVINLLINGITGLFRH